MTEPTTSTLIPVAAGMGLAALLPGIDGDALLGAFAGATLFVVSAQSLPVWRRIVYLLISVIAGYLAANDVLAWFPLKSSGVAAFMASAIAVTVMLAVIKQCEQINFKRLFGRKGSPDA